MRALIQVVDQAEVTVDSMAVGSCGAGLCIFVGVVPTDTEGVADRLWHKISHLRIFADGQGKTNLSVHDVKGSVLLVSQFTLCADVSRGMRPSFTGAAKPDLARRLFDHLVDEARRDLGEDRVGEGVFGAHMKVSLTNNGPFTIWLDTETL